MRLLNNERKSVIITFAILVVLSGLIHLGITLTLTVCSVFLGSVIEMIRHMSDAEDKEHLVWRNDIF